MPAYIIVTREEPLRDPESMKEYQTLTRQMTTAVKPAPKVVYGEVQALEGEAPDGVIMLEFPTMEEARQWYFSEDYQKALPKRLQAARHRAFLVEGL
ncbi:DUF1330 domain-containing protein [Pseudomaricurvus sp. HS19]|uniref:DUF1330 domain-containing protein n=1 Tax=Pseudomaricurvus sp. HS19 TaxID=2692626 RepID=UPI00136D9EA7|nr:DUF1330 domain-containing protein [Pseudomaricurvus sp. HS19]MYM62255.1 DUF1330 domain-containing protein [Pseudomaricurvus sp. HS19]